MNPTKDQTSRDEFNAVLDELTKRGWITRWAVSGGGYAIEWTAKGRERVGWLRTIDGELSAGERAMTLVMAACCAFGPKEGG